MIIAIKLLVSLLGGAVVALIAALTNNRKLGSQVELDKASQNVAVDQDEVAKADANVQEAEKEYENAISPINK
jgi:hypothetical protein